jgi:glycosyltransferase involved in cell wall biosynthesis
MKRKERISVLIAAYDTAPFIADMIRSVLLQYIPPEHQLELIIGVDGCDQTWKEAVKFERFGVTLVKMRSNYGPYITFNTIMKYATGDWIARFDADDVMLPGYLHHQLQLFKTHPTVKLTRTWSIYTDQHYRPIRARLADNRFTAADGRRNSGSDGQFMMARVVWDTLGGFKPWKCFADTDFLTRCKIAGYRIAEVRKHLYVRRVHPGSLTSRKETDYNSSVRNRYRREMEMDKTNYINGRPLFVTPFKGRIAHVV